MSLNKLLNKLDETIDFIQSKTKLTPKIGITLGSGLSSFADKIEVDVTLPYKEIPHLSPPSVEGHKGQLVIGKIKNKEVAILQGRLHFYEGHSYEHVVFPTRVLGHMGVNTLILTNASGGINPKMKPGQLMIIEDHINLTGNNPLIGPNENKLGPRFPDMSEPYNLDLRKLLEQTMKELNINYTKGIYCGVLGPTYETAAEIKFMQTIGGSAVGMSTVPETIAAHHMGMNVCGICCITNLATGVSNQIITHKDVNVVAKQVESDFTHLLLEFVERI